VEAFVPIREDEACEVEDPSSALFNDAARAVELFWLTMLDDPVAAAADDAAAGESDVGKVEGLEEEDELGIDVAAKEEARPTREGSYESVRLRGGTTPGDEEVAMPAVP
jgi:hypothetical protein